MALRLLLLLLPAGALLFSAYLALAPAATLSSAHQELITLVPYVLTGVVALLGYGFNRSRILFAALNLCAAYYLIQSGLQTSLKHPDAYVLFSALSLLLPLNTALIALYRERGLLTPLGLARIITLTGGYAALYSLQQAGQLGYYLPQLPMSMLEMLVYDTFLSQAAALAFLLALIPTLLAFILRRTHADAGLLASLMAALIMILWFDRPLISALFVSAALVALATSVLQNSYNMAFIDELTGIPGRRALRDRLALLGRRYTVAMLDIDHFKQFNDSYGHDVGDQVLRMVAAKIARVRGGGRAFRYGGEEFTVLFPGKDEAQARPYLDELRQEIAGYPLQIRSPQRPDDAEAGRKLRNGEDGTETVSVTISIGLCEKSEAHQSPDEVIKSADKALYAAKRAGRNRTVAASDPSLPTRAPRARKDYGGTG